MAGRGSDSKPVTGSKEAGEGDDFGIDCCAECGMVRCHPVPLGIEAEDA